MKIEHVTSTERHGELIERGWRVGIDGKWRSPDPADISHYSFAEAWRAHAEPTDPKDAA